MKTAAVALLALLLLSCTRHDTQRESSIFRRESHCEFICGIR